MQELLTELGKESPKEEVAVPRWDDSDTEQQTLHDLHTTLKKEKSRENRKKAATKQIQEEGDNNNSQTMEQASLSEKSRQSEGEGAEDRSMVKIPEGTMKAEKLKTGGENGPYQPFIVKNPDGKRVIVYHFNEGSMAFYEALEDDSQAVMPKVAEKAEAYIRRGWQEFFSVLRILTSVFILLAVEAASFAVNHLARPLLLGVLTTLGNRLVKPLLAVLFNLILHPVLIFLWNVLSGVRRICEPLVDIVGSFTAKVATLLQAFRLVEVNRGSYGGYFPDRRALVGGDKMNGVEAV